MAKKREQDDLSEFDKFDPLGRLTAEQARRAAEQAQKKIDADDRDFTEAIRKYDEKKKSQTPADRKDD